jgi:hypothetical protein
VKYKSKSFTQTFAKPGKKTIVTSSLWSHSIPNRGPAGPQRSRCPFC